MERLNWINSNFDDLDGYGRWGMRKIRALSEQGVDVWPTTLDVFDHPVWMQRLMGFDASRLTITCAPQRVLHSIPGRHWLLSMYETTTIKEEWADAINDNCQRLIVPSPWLVDVYKKGGVYLPIDIIPGGIDPTEFPIQFRRVNDHPYTFLCFGDRDDRKGYDLVYRAFYCAFAEDRDVRLIIKCREGGLSFLSSAIADTRVKIWREDVKDMADVYGRADCLVFPTRGEGFGLPPREAASTGLPVIATNWGGTADHIDQWAISINKYEMVSASKAMGGRWAEPDVDEIAQHMRWCYEHQEEAKQKGLQSATWLRRNLTWDQAACALLELIRKSGECL